MIHLTHTGPAAGQPLCGAARTPAGEYHHPNVQALEKPEYRERICIHCLFAWGALFPDDQDRYIRAALAESVDALNAARERLETNDKTSGEAVLALVEDVVKAMWWVRSAMSMMHTRRGVPHDPT